MTEQKHKLYSTALCMSGRAALAPINGREVSVIGYRTADLGSVYTVTHESKSPRSFECFEFELRPVVSPINRERADSRHALVADVLAVAAERLNVILNPWGFYFTNDGVRSSHCGPFASGYYCRKTTRIEISCRDTIDNLYYQHTFLVPHAYCTESERYTIDHAWLMEALGHNNDCHLITTNQHPDAIKARDGGDRVVALINDLALFASPILREPSKEFDEIIRRGSRAYSIVF